MNAIDKRKVAVLLLEVQMSNPNGDPDADNAPRQIDGPEGVHGFMTDSCIKRKVRDTAKEFHDAPLYVDHGNFRSEIQAKYPSAEAMLRDMWDIRVFGGTLTNFSNKGRVTGPIQINLAQSAFPVQIVDIGITCVAGEKKSEENLEKEREKKRKKQERAGIEAVEQDDDENQLRANMGRKYVIQHALIPVHIYFNPSMAERTGLDEEDLRVFWDSLITCWDHDKAGARTGIRFRRLVVFEHDSFRGCEHSHRSIERVQIALQDGVDQPQRFEDYDITVDTSGTEGRIEVFDFDDSTFSLMDEAA